MTPPASHPALAHRAAGAILRTVPSVGIEDLGGIEAVHEAADLFYDAIEHDRELRRKFGGDIDGERRRLGAFLVEFLGGPPEWSAQFARQDLVAAHRFIHITAEDADRWLAHAADALLFVAPAAGVGHLAAALRPIAHSLVNEVEPQSPRASRESRFAATRDAVRLCVRGDFVSLLTLLDGHPHLVEPGDPGSAELVHAAAVKGHVAVLRALIERGADVNKPARASEGLMVTPLCGATAARKREAMKLLVDAGAITDVFTLAYLGERGDLSAAIETDPSLANAADPASDFYGAAVLDHGVLGVDPVGIVPLLVDLGARAGPHTHRLVAHAAGSGQPEVVRSLLDAGADARNVTPGRWVLDRTCAPLLFAGGADVNHAPTRWDSWIWKSCNANKGRKDDPDYVSALLAAGADVRTRVFGKTALHFSVKAGFAATSRLLLEAGADPNALDADGRSPLWHLLLAGARVDRPALARLLIEFDADPAMTDAKGRSLAKEVFADKRRPLDERRALVDVLTVHERSGGAN